MLTLMLLASTLTCLITSLILVSYYRVAPNIKGAVREYRELLEKIDNVYIGHFDVDEVSAAALHAAVEALGDRWSYYMTPVEYANYLDRSNNRFTGIGVGVVVDTETGYIRVQYVIKGSAAETAGLEAGDLITGVDGEDIHGNDIDELRTLLLRPIGETVDLSVLRADGDTQMITVVYSYVFNDPVEFELIGDEIGYVSLSNFDAGSADSFISAVQTLIEQGAEGFIFDVRSNGGGRVTEMTRILDFLLPEGEIFVTVDRSGREESIYSDAKMIDKPAVVLVNSNSFSAAEYFAATLREYGYAEIVGEHTTGKSRMQNNFVFPWGGALHISTSEYLTRNRVRLHDVGGLEPDHTVPLSDEEYMLFVTGRLDKDDDPQLQQALLLLLTP